MKAPSNKPTVRKNRMNQKFLPIAALLLILACPGLSLAATATTFSSAYFINKQSNLGMPILLKAQLKTTGGVPLSGKTVSFDIYYGDSWHPVPNDGSMSGAVTSLVTDASGIASVYYFVEPTLAPGTYNIQASFAGDATHDATAIAATLTVKKALVTFALFLNGDNNLESAAVTDFVDEVYPGGINDNINFIVLFDRHPNDYYPYSGAFGGWTDTRLYIVTPETVASSIYLYQAWGEMNMGSPNTLSTFAGYVFDSFPADQKTLVLWDHGSGWAPSKKAEALAEVTGYTEVGFPIPDEVAARLASLKKTAALATEDDQEVFKYISTDSSSGGDKLTMAELTQALVDSGHVVDILAMDACLMGMMEVAYQVKDLTRYYVASEDLIPAEGFPYDLIAQGIQPGMTARDAASLMVDAYQAYYSDPDNAYWSTTLAAYDMTAMALVYVALENLAQAFLDNMEQIPLAQRQALRSAAQGMDDGYDYHKDLGSLAHYTTQIIQNAAVVSAAQALENQLASPALINFQKYVGRLQYDTAGMKGLAIYWPIFSAYKSDYSSASVIDFAALSWDEAVRLLLDVTAPSPTPSWVSAPQAASALSVTMQCSTATDQYGNTVYYEFAFTDSPTGGTGGSDSGNRYGSTTFTDDGLEPNNQYCYKVRAHDGAGNYTNYSSTLCAITLAAAPGAAPFILTGNTSVRANWTANGNPEGVEYYCENATAATNSGWTTNFSWNCTGLEPGTSNSFRVKARNADNVETAWTELGTIQAGYSWGDVNGDDWVTLADLVLCLQISAGLKPDNVSREQAIDALRQIGLDEALYILQVVGEFRTWEGTK